MKWIYASITLCLFFGGIPLSAKTVESTGLTTHFSNSTFTKNEYVATLDFETEAIYKEDLVVIAEDVLMKGYIEGDLISAAKDIEVKGEVRGDVRILGGTVILKGKIGGDLLVFGGKVVLTSASQIEGRAIILGGTLDFDGKIKDSSRIIAGDILLRGEFRDDISITTQEMVILDESKFNREKENRYFAPRPAEIPDVLKDVFVYNQTSIWYQNSSLQERTSTLLGFWILLKFITDGLLIFLIYFLFRDFSEQVRSQGSKHWLKSCMIGAIALFTIPTIALLLIVSLIGLPIGLLLFVVLWTFLIIRIGLISFIVSVWIQKIWNKYKKREAEDNPYRIVLFSIIALALVNIVRYVPFIGALTISALSLIAFGGVLLVVYKAVFRR